MSDERALLEQCQPFEIRLAPELVKRVEAELEALLRREGVSEKLAGIEGIIGIPKPKSLEEFISILVMLGVELADRCVPEHEAPPAASCAPHMN